MSDISELREWANNKIKLYDKMAVEAPHLYASDVNRSMLRQVVELCDKTAWHYPSRGEYPTENGEYWVAWRSPRTGHLMYGVGLWELDRFLLNPQPKAWQYIEPPKEEA